MPVSERLERFELDLTAGLPPKPSSQSDARPHEPTFTPVPAGSAEMEHRGGGVSTLEHPRVAMPARIASVLAPTNDLIDRMWMNGSKAEPIEGWMIGEMDTESTVMARRVFLGTVITIGIALVVAMTWFIAGRGDASVESTVADIEAAQQDLSGALSTSDSVFADLRDGVLDDREGAAATATVIDSAARDLFAIGADLPATSDWGDLRTDTVAASDRAIAYARLISRTTSYISTVDVMFNRPDYPVTVNDTDLGEVAEMTATWVTRFIATSSSLPEIGGLEDHRLSVLAMAEYLPKWQSTYLDALRAGDVEVAGTAVSDLHGRVIQLGEGLNAGMSQVADKLESEQSAIVAAIDS